MKLGIAFEGCACRSAFHAGVAWTLSEAGVHADLAAGSSSGSLVAAAVALRRAEEMPATWKALSGRSVLSVRRALWNRSIFDMSHLVRTTLRGFAGSGDLRSAPGEALACATSLRRLGSVIFSSRDEEDFIEPLLGSCFVPPFYGRVVRHKGDLLFDGGFSDNLPLEALVSRGATEIIAVVTSPEGTAIKSPTNLRWRPRATGAVVHVVRPHRPLAIGYWDFDPGRVEAAIDAGRTAGSRFLATRRLVVDRVGVVD